jgi:hypothetical protein
MITKYKIFLENFNWNKIEDEYHIQDHLGNKFKVEFIKDDEQSVELKYYYYDGNNWSVDKLVGTNPFKIVSTIFGDILQDFIKNNKWCNEVYINGLAKESEKEFITQRTKMYLRYLNNNKPVGFDIDRTDNDIIVYRK